MQYLCVDESGSMTTQHLANCPYFVIAVVRTENPVKLRRLCKRFAKKYCDALKAADTENRMFQNGKFLELKGYALTPDLKRSFVDFFCRQGTLEVYYIVLDNRNISAQLYSNTAWAFNYTLKLALEYFIKGNYLPDDSYAINLDERNERTETRHFLQNYLNTELGMSGTLSHNVSVKYFDSSTVWNIQIADVLANLYYSELRTSNYTREFEKMKENNCLKIIFKFPE